MKSEMTYSTFHLHYSHAHVHSQSGVFPVEMNSLYLLLMICLNPLNYFLNEIFKGGGVSGQREQ